MLYIGQEKEGLMKVKIYRIDKDNLLPLQANKGDAGYDCFASKDVYFCAEEIKLVPLGIIAQAPEGYHFKLCLRSSLAKKRGFTLANGVGIIDYLYSGENDEIKALLKAPGYENHTSLWIDRIIRKGERIAQLILEKNEEIEWDEQEERNFVEKSRGGFGSSGE